MVKEVDDYGVIRYYNKNGEIHREDGPAVILSDGTQVWHYNGKRHREDGPSIIYSNGKKIWFKNGEIHREDGPAVILSDGEIEWYYSGKNYSFNKWCELVNISEEEKMELVLRYG